MARTKTSALYEFLKISQSLFDIFNNFIIICVSLKKPFKLKSSCYFFMVFLFFYFPQILFTFSVSFSFFCLNY